MSGPALLLALTMLVVTAWGLPPEARSPETRPAPQADPSPPAAQDPHASQAPATVPQCTVSTPPPPPPAEVTGEQVANARTIAAVARERGLPERAVVIALATAQQESQLRNIDFGDRDSLGLFQQRPSQGWGTPEQVQNPVYAAGQFYDHLVQVPDWQTGRLTDVAQAVQRSAYPELYQQWEGLATALTATVTPTPPATPTCP